MVAALPPDVVQVDGDECERARGTVVPIDVLRAFTTAAYALASGAREIILVETVDQAFALRRERPGSIIVGEVQGRPVPGFDFGNSPAELAGAELRDKLLIQRTTAGTRAALNSSRAEAIVPASLVVAEATARYVRSLSSSLVTLVRTGKHGGKGGDDDWACADYLQARLRGEEMSFAEVADRIRKSSAAQKFLDPERSEFPRQDLEMALEVDRFDFALATRWHRGQLVVNAASSGGAG